LKSGKVKGLLSLIFYNAPRLSPPPPPPPPKNFAKGLASNFLGGPVIPGEKEKKPE